ncbi:hypothetical protein [Streptomyces aureocirculatus]|uniref:hypothetical protein n=1 Tax=Streptomyces aureocirculatus TaxID=67275 RepID=UPI0004CA9F49|nr:hypothetical protein [Streptomyces aureocirculatus]
MVRNPARQAARHSAPKSFSASRALLRAGLTVSAAGAAIGLGATAASAAAPPARGLETVAGDAGVAGVATAGNALLNGLQRATVGGLGPVKDLRLNPLAGTDTDPLDNSVGTQIADFKPVSTATVTKPLTRGSSLAELPVVDRVTGTLPE